MEPKKPTKLNYFAATRLELGVSGDNVTPFHQALALQDSACSASGEPIPPEPGCQAEGLSGYVDVGGNPFLAVYQHKDGFLFNTQLITNIVLQTAPMIMQFYNH